MDLSLPDGLLDGLSCPPQSPAPSDAAGLEEIDFADAMLDLVVWPEPDQSDEFDEETGSKVPQEAEGVNEVAEIPPPPPLIIRPPATVLVVTCRQHGR